MRNAYFLLAAAAITITSCSKSSHSVPDNGCIERVVIPQSPPYISPSGTKTADSLFDVNHIDHSHYRWLFYNQDTANGHFYQFVSLDQYTNGLRIFNEQATVSFSDGVTFYSSLHPTQGTTLDTVPSLALSRLRTFFSADLRKRAASIGSGFTDSCYRAEFGYWNIAKESDPEHLVKAWRVTIKYTDKPYPLDYFPCGYYLDSNGQLISFIGPLYLD